MFSGGGEKAADATSAEGGRGRVGAAATPAEKGTPEAREGPEGSTPAEHVDAFGRAGLTSARSTEQERFHEFVTARWLALLRMAYLLTGDHGHAEDLVQIALIRVHRHWGKIERSGSPEAYVRKVLINAHTDGWRRARLRQRAERLTSDFDELCAADAYRSVELRDELWAALLSLPAKMRAALVLRFFEDLTEAETARILDCSVGTVKSQTSRGLQRLQQALTEQSPGESSQPFATPLPVKARTRASTADCVSQAPGSTKPDSQPSDMAAGARALLPQPLPLPQPSAMAGEAPPPTSVPAARAVAAASQDSPSRPAGGAAADSPVPARPARGLIAAPIVGPPPTGGLPA